MNIFRISVEKSLLKMQHEKRVLYKETYVHLL